jgi:hypothetical protein
MTTIIERLRNRRTTVDYSTATLLEEAAREIERLADERETYRQAAEYLKGDSSANWPDDA